MNYALTCKLSPSAERHLARGLNRKNTHLAPTLLCNLKGRYKGAVAIDVCTAMSIHIGREIEAELRRQGRGATWLSQRLYCDRTNVYNIFKRQGIDTVLLQRISDVLKRNFFALYCPEEGAGAENNSTDS